MKATQGNAHRVNDGIWYIVGAQYYNNSSVPWMAAHEMELTLNREQITTLAGGRAAVDFREQFSLLTSPNVWKIPLQASTERNIRMKIFLGSQI